MNEGVQKIRVEQKSGVQGAWLRTWLDVGETDTYEQIKVDRINGKIM
jgi:hypothetical protein